jgi:hypothetical protein
MCTNVNQINVMRNDVEGTSWGLLKGWIVKNENAGV